MVNDMVELGKMNRLTVVKQVDFGMYLDGGEMHGNILLPSRYVPEGTKIGDTLDVFLYLDQDERLVATTERPLAQVGDFAWLDTNGNGKWDGGDYRLGRQPERVVYFRKTIDVRANWDFEEQMEL